MSGPHDGNQPGWPKARIRKSWRTRLLWLVPLGAAILAGWFIYQEVHEVGPTLHITFENAAGLQPGKSQIKYRGVKIGTVDDVRLTDDHQGVRVTVSLDRSSESVAREGSQFWIVQPRIRLEEIRGLRTIVAGDYITVEPGQGKRQTRFIGRSQPPAPAGEEEGLRIVLLAEDAGSVKQHTPVLYRGINVGEVRDFDLGPLSQDVKIYVDIKKEYESLVRMNSRFWNAGGVNFSLSLSGVDISAQSAHTLIAGGIAFATPDEKDARAAPGTAFRLYDKPDSSWLKWAPAMKHRHVAAAERVHRAEEIP